MPPTPLYSAHNLNPAYHLRYSWTSWPSGSRFANLPDPEILETITPLWEEDGLRLLERNWSQERIQLTFSAKPHVSPVFLGARVKGRLQYAFRQAGHASLQFSRKLCVRSVGDNRTADVEAYITRQVDKSDFVDPAFRDSLREFTVKDPSVDLSEPTVTARGRYWYNLHVVLAVQQKQPIRNLEKLRTARDCCPKIARKKGHAISIKSVMPDHLHLALRGNPEQSPEEIALAFQNNLAFALGQNAVWEYNYYVGTFGEYDMGAVRQSVSPE